ncbi:MAG TPA: hypothetical protein VHY08_07515, partial [Bacillota bacterium]|nr:hypothetical protein [Bacillota bacterium]
MKKSIGYLLIVFLILTFALAGCDGRGAPAKTATKTPIQPYSGTDPNPADKTVFIAMQPWYGNPVEGPSASWYHWDFNSHYPSD